MENTINENGELKIDNNIDLSKKEEQDTIKLMGMVFFFGNIFFGLGLFFLIIMYFLIKNKRELTQNEKQTFYNILNASLSYFIYFVISGALILILIGIILIIIILTLSIIFSIIGLIKHLNGEVYEYPFTIKFFK